MISTITVEHMPYWIHLSTQFHIYISLFYSISAWGLCLTRDGLTISSFGHFRFSLQEDLWMVLWMDFMVSCYPLWILLSQCCQWSSRRRIRPQSLAEKVKCYFWQHGMMLLELVAVVGDVMLALGVPPHVLELILEHLLLVGLLVINVLIDFLSSFSHFYSIFFRFFSKNADVFGVSTLFPHLFILGSDFWKGWLRLWDYRCFFRQGDAPIWA